ncbi:MAG: sulfite exporter TauE/SafE family protein [Bacteroidales bacterium]|nr:sulfite exporter TauE/SafE family protein [Bacteroidales bacterium]MBN2757644.1 sulfite exporter TauE/SafE family protein [Bacteroidales bacterium]
MEWYIILLVIVIGFVAGFINTLAGSGSLLTLPLLMFLGLPANVANGTNRIGILFQSIVASSSFKHNKVLDYKAGLWLGVPSIIGAIAGSIWAVNLTDEIMRIFIGVLLVVMFFIILYKPEAWIKGQAGKVKEKPSIFQLIIFFIIGLYGGFIQAGVGFFLLGGLVLGAGYDLIKANAIKVFITLLFTIPALLVFIINNQIDYILGFVLAIGSMLGAFVATKFAIKKGAIYVRYVLLFAIGLSSLKLFGLF